MKLKQNIFKTPSAHKPTPQGNAGYDNARENIDPHIKTKVVSSMEGTVEKVPVNNSDIVNKAYVDSVIPAAYTDADAVAAVATADDYLKNDGDTATGDYNFDSNTLFIDSTNNRVGIGTATPGEKLDIVGNTQQTSTNPYLKLRSTATGSGGLQWFNGTTTQNSQLVVGSGGGYFDIPGNTFLNFREYGLWNSLLYLDGANNRVGIGTATPSANLVVSNAGAEGMEFYKNVGGNSVQMQAYNRSGTTYCNQWYNAATHVFKIAGTTNMTIASGDVYTEAWTDYSATSTVVGWVTPSKVIKYKKIGKLVMVTFSISGTSNSTAASFTLPYAAKTGSDFGGACLYAMDNTAAIPTATAIYMPSASSTVSLYSDMALGTWTASGAKGIKGTFWYEAA